MYNNVSTCSAQLKRGVLVTPCQLCIQNTLNKLLARWRGPYLDKLLLGAVTNLLEQTAGEMEGTLPSIVQ